MNDLAAIDSDGLKLLINLFLCRCEGQDAGSVRTPVHMLARIGEELFGRKIGAVLVKEPQVGFAQ